MEALEKAKLALREHLLDNRDRVLSDLEEMRKKSEGNDIFNYVENLSEPFSWSDVSTLKCSKMVFIDKINFNQIEFCKRNKLINNLKPDVAKQLDICAFYAIIEPDLIEFFDAL